ncbi:FAD-dependent monooxygenase [Aestuariivirga sp.]|uniref:FAD binding domain-containing protein n=1 Tax=Aestuariivirga sp. TaxID=2650926 RepID=UPI0030193BC9
MKIESVPLTVAIIGGSVAGLTAAIELRSLGCHVEVFERSATEMKSRGGGIVLQQNVIDWFSGTLGLPIDQVSTRTDFLRYFDRDSNVVSNRTKIWHNTSWSTLHRTLLAAFGNDNYRTGAVAVDIEQDEHEAVVTFEDGSICSADLVIFADGISSVGRARLSPQTHPEYAGYIGWRGTVEESLLTPATLAALADSMSYYVGENTHIILYPIPGPDGQLSVGERLMNFVWYRNIPAGDQYTSMVTDRKGRISSVSVPAGEVKQEFVDQVRIDAEFLLPKVASEVVVKTAQPYIQIMQDTIADRMAYGRVALIGDAAFASRPHAAAWTAKAVSDGLTLAEHLEKSQFDVSEALATWEPAQLEIGRNLFNRVREMGARSQFENSWVPGDPAFDFGLLGPDI